MNTIKRIELASDLISLASGQIPHSFAFKLIPMFFRRKKRLTKAQLKKLMMTRRRMFVDNVLMVNERRLQKKNLEDKIDQTKSRLLSRKPQKILGKPSLSPKLTPSRSRSNTRWQSQSSPQQGDRHKTKIQGLVDSERGKVRSKWALRVAVQSGSTKEI